MKECYQIMEGFLYAVKLEDFLVPQQSQTTLHFMTYNRGIFHYLFFKALLLGLQTDRLMHWMSVSRFWQQGGYREEQQEAGAALCRTWLIPAGSHRPTTRHHGAHQPHVAHPSKHTQERAKMLGRQGRKRKGE